MPIYDYRCDHCGHVFSAVRAFTDTDLEACPNCGKRPRKLLTAPAVVFKGSGWYKTDSRGKAPSEDGGSSSSTAKDVASTATGAAPAPAAPAAETKTSAPAAKTGGEAKS